MHNEEFRTPKDIEIKFQRLIFPPLNLEDLPLHGLYNPIDNEESQEYSLFDKFKNFDITSNKSPNIENLFSIHNNFGKIFINEYLEGIVILYNTSENEIIIKDLRATIKKCEEKPENVAEPVEIEIQNNSEILPPKKSYTFKIKTKALYVPTKYRIDIYFHTKSTAYDQLYQMYIKSRPKAIPKENNEKFSVINGSVEFSLKKKLTFEVNNPFKINEKYHSYPNDKYLIEIIIFNCTLYTLTLLDIFLSLKDNKEKIPLVQDLEEIKCNKYNLNNNDSKYLTLQPEEQIIALFEIDKGDLYKDEKIFILNISWLNICDFNTKLYTYEVNNIFCTYNEFYKISIKEKPNDIILNQNFKIVINLESKNSNKVYNINIMREPKKNRDVKIIEINDNNIELNQIFPSKNIVIICNSDILGNVNLPKLKFVLYEENSDIPIEHFYENLICFNCVEK